MRIAVDAYPGRSFEGTITTIEPQIATDTRNIRVQATMKGENDANQLVKTIADGRDAALKQLAMFKGNPVPGLNVNAMTTTLESIQLQTDGGVVHLQILVHPEAMGTLR